MRRKDMDGFRSCTTCGGMFPATPEHFYQRKSGILSSECRDCFRQRSSRNQHARHHGGGVDYHLSFIARGMRQRARKNGVECEIDAVFLKELLDEQGGLCAISQVPLTFEKGRGHIATNASIDRVDPRKGYTKDNVQLVAHQVNTMKSNLSIVQFVEWCRLVINGSK